MRILTLFGTRPEIIRLSEVIRLLDRFAEQVLVHTGQNYDPKLSDVFFRDLDVRQPDVHLGVKAAGFAEQSGQILCRVGEVFERVKPDRILILGDTNSGLGAVVAARMGIPVYHMEAGNRCYDDRVPEEINRRVIDHCSTVLMPYTRRSQENLVREGIERHRIYVIGNPIFEVLQKHGARIDGSPILADLGVAPGQYFLATLHRAENVDDPGRLSQFFEALARVARSHALPVVVSVHPRTADRLRRSGMPAGSGDLRLIEPVGFPEFVKLERHARAVLSDSGTVQEECCIFGVPNVTLRDVTERPETIECGSNVLTGADPATIEQALSVALECPRDWTPPAEYVEARVSRTVVKVITGYRQS